MQRSEMEKIWDSADEADRLADLIQRRMHDSESPITKDRRSHVYDLAAQLRTHLSDIKRRSNTRPGGA